MKSDQIKHSLAVGPKSIQSRVYDRETGELISFVKMPLEETGLVSREALAEQPAHVAAVNTSSERVDKTEENVHEKPAQQLEHVIDCPRCGHCCPQPAQQQEPVAWILKPTMELLWPDEIEVKDPSKHRGYKPLYTSPQPSKPWVGLTQEDMYEIGEFKNTHGYVPTGFKRLAAALEAKLREKNA